MFPTVPVISSDVPRTRKHWFILWLVPIGNLSVPRANAGNNGDPSPKDIQLGSHPAYLEFHERHFRLLFSKQSFLKVKEVPL